MIFKTSNPIGTRFTGNKLITKFNELKQFTNSKTIDRRAFEGCTALVELDCRNFTGRTTGEPHMWHSCNSLDKLILSNYAGGFGYGGNINNNRACLGYCKSLKRLILPKITEYNGVHDDNIFTPTMIDLGPNVTGMYGNGGRGFTNNCTFVLRRATPPSFNNLTTIALKALYVPEEAVEDYKAASVWSKVEAKIFAIGGEEWVEQFGNSDPYANLTEQEYQDNYA